MKKVQKYHDAVTRIPTGHSRLKTEGVSYDVLKNVLASGSIYVEAWG